MHKIIDVIPLKDYRLRLKFSDGVEGIVDLSHLAGKGVFKAWESIDFFNSVRINRETKTVEWEGGIDLCPDNLYAKILGKDPSTILAVKAPEGERV